MSEVKIKKGRVNNWYILISFSLDKHKLSFCQQDERIFTPVLKVKVKARSQKQFLVKHQEDDKSPNWGWV